MATPDKEKDKKEKETRPEDTEANAKNAAAAAQAEKRNTLAATALAEEENIVPPLDRLRQSKEALDARRKTEAEEKERAAREAERLQKEAKERGNLTKGLEEVAKLELLTRIGEQAYTDGEEGLGGEVAKMLRNIERNVKEKRTPDLDWRLQNIAVEAAQRLNKEEMKKLDLVPLLQNARTQLVQQRALRKEQLLDKRGGGYLNFEDDRELKDYYDDPLRKINGAIERLSE